MQSRGVELVAAFGRVAHDAEYLDRGFDCVDLVEVGLPEVREDVLLPLGALHHQAEPGHEPGLHLVSRSLPSSAPSR